MNRVIPIGTEFFAKLRENNYYFVDKTTFLSAFFRGHADVTLITRPRRFGKTLLLSMTQQFLDIEGAEEHRKLFEGLQVMDDPVAMKEQGTRPVVFLTLRDWDSNTWESMQDFVRFGLQDVCRPLQYLLESNHVSTKDKHDFELLWNREGDLSLMRRALTLFCKMMRDHYGRNAVLLIDEYDAPLQSAWSHGYYDEAIDFYRGFFASALKSNPALDFAILTGVLRVAKESIFSGLNNLKVSTVMHGGFADACGYTKAEVAKLAHDLGHDDKLEELASWYDGYDFQGTEIYNPWSVNNYFSENCAAEKYWVDTSSNDIIQTLLAQADEARWDELRSLLVGGTVTSQIREGVIYKDIGRDASDIYTMLLQTGYLKAVKCMNLGGERLYELAIPNREIRLLYQTEILDRVDHSYGIVSFYKMGLAIQQGDAAEFQKIFQGILLRAVSSHDAADAENFYHGLMLGCALYYEPDYRVVSNRESGYGRFDLAMLPKKQELPGIVMEFKTAASEDGLEQATEDALRQIEDRAYITELEASGTKSIWKYGIAFCKKRVLVRRGNA